MKMPCTKLTFDGNMYLHSLKYSNLTSTLRPLIKNWMWVALSSTNSQIYIIALHCQITKSNNSWLEQFTKSNIFNHHQSQLSLWWHKSTIIDHFSSCQWPDVAWMKRMHTCATCYCLHEENACWYHMGKCILVEKERKALINAGKEKLKVFSSMSQSTIHNLNMIPF